MLSFQEMRMRTDYMMEVIRRQAIDETIKKFEKAAREYYTVGYDHGETVKLIHQLEDLGVDPEIVTEMDLAIRDECCFGIKR